MRKMTIEEAAFRLPEIIREAGEDGQSILLQSGAEIAILIPMSRRKSCARRGSMKGMVLSIAEDFNEIPEGFEDYTS